MNTLFDLIKKYGEGKGEGVMWKSVRVISDAIDRHMDEDTKKALARSIYSEMAGGHYDEDFAMEDTAKMYYVGTDGKKHYAPYWTEEQVKEVYDSVKADIKAYNMWDFFVTLNMIKSDNCPLMGRWFPDATPEVMDKKFVDLAVNWLRDEDYRWPNEKIWHYLNS